jgi:Na+/proline symporter
MLTPTLILGLVGAYFALLMAVAWRTGRGGGNDDFFIGGHRSPWLLVAFGMIGTSLSGVTFLSVPGVVGAGSGPNQQFGYMQVVLGYLVGYAFIAGVLMPLYYRLRLTSIYTWLDGRYGPASYKTGAGFFLLSRTLGASFRIFLVTGVFQAFVLDPMGVPYAVTIAATLALIWIYTYQGGIRTIVFTDTIQTAFMLAAVALTVAYMARELGLGPGGVAPAIREAGLGQWFFWDPAAPGYFWKQFLSGAAIATVMTGLDQDMMQKNNSCPDIRSAQKNMLVFSVVLVFVNLLFLALGALMHLYAARQGIAVPDNTDHLYPTLALGHFPALYGAVFLIGLIAAAFSSADSALTALTTSFCVDILGLRAGVVEAFGRRPRAGRRRCGGTRSPRPTYPLGGARRFLGHGAADLFRLPRLGAGRRARQPVQGRRIHLRPPAGALRLRPGHATPRARRLGARHQPAVGGHLPGPGRAGHRRPPGGPVGPGRGALAGRGGPPAGRLPLRLRDPHPQRNFDELRPPFGVPARRAFGRRRPLTSPFPRP